ncbi:hypothetical protein GALMADRAFT_76109 [Galerina marginata CBS 339.88]|uniref:Uncharacterized protein n=1 Tax=Galerina marginata (strain CBS 339.88) TaxID=685588 RepID=A0A067SRL3_GALM3|nr:hypothetical protein GALMADRAFT_76109 [Galerina marginata CBS 339.88]
MLFILTTLYLLQGFFNADAAPLSTLLPRQASNTSVPALPQECICPNTRSQLDIIWSCLATIFVCTWVSIHPNIPALEEPRWKKVLRRLELMFWSIIAPEVIIFWAAQQWAAARELATKYREYGWTMSHGYFIQMGGFMLYNNDKPIGVLGPNELDRLVEEEKLVMPRTTKEEIQDRSKSDGLSKALGVIQTTWFINQCIARRVQGLIITELELVTLAFAALNGVIYMFWWFKPLDVQTTVRVDLLPSVRPQKVLVGPETMKIIPQLIFPWLSLILEIEIERENLILSLEVSSRPYQSIKDSKFRDICSLVWWLLSGVLFCWPAAGVRAVLTRIRDIYDSDIIDKGAMSVPMFYAFFTGSPSTDSCGQYKETYAGFFVVISFPFVGILFGAIHCTGWGFSFHSLIEANIWRVSSAIITSVPVMVLVVVQDLLETFTGIVILASILLYIVARLALLVVAFTTLRDLPPGALATVKWTSFLPHI